MRDAQFRQKDFELVKIVQFGLCFSPNLGDGVIAECIGHAVREIRPDAKVTHVDMSARKGFGQVVIKNREAIIAVIDRLPLFVRQRLALWKLNRVIDGVEDTWKEAAQADLAIVGGGQIFSDASLNFPIKIGRVFDILRDAKTPTAIFGVGVAQNWTTKGKALFHKMQHLDLRMVGVRDVGSEAAWKAQVPFVPRPELTLDPGLFAAAHYGSAEVTGDLGLCITDFVILSHHASGGVAGAAQGGVGFYAEIVKTARAKGYRVTLFSNGAAEDQALLEKVAEHPDVAAARAEGHVVLPPAPSTPTELVAIIASCRAVIAHRLHACIVAYSYRRPIVGLGWDAKLESFFETAGVEKSFSSDPNLTAEDVMSLAINAIAEGIDPNAHAALLDQAWDGVRRLIDCAGRPSVA